MREQLMEILAEPGTGAALQLKVTRGGGGRIEEGQLISQRSGKTYPIIRGIPRFVEGDNYTGSFGTQWNRFREVQVDSATGATYSQKRLDAEAGWTRDELSGKWLLDAGCGAGRFAEVAAARGPNLVALDYSSAVEAAKKTLSRFPTTDVVQADLLSPPFLPGVFDFSYCIGVVQHTPDPRAAVRSVLSCVREGGRFSFTMYARRLWTKLNGKYLIRPLTRRLPQPLLLQAIESAMPAIFPLTDRLFGLPRLGRLFQFLIPVATYVHSGEFTREQRFREAVLDTFDMLAPQYDSPLNWREVEALLHGAGAAGWEFRQKVPINVVGTR